MWSGRRGVGALTTKFVAFIVQGSTADSNIQKLLFAIFQDIWKKTKDFVGAVMKFASEDELGSIPQDHRIVWSEGVRENFYGLESSDSGVMKRIRARYRTSNGMRTMRIQNPDMDGGSAWVRAFII